MKAELAIYALLQGFAGGRVYPLLAPQDGPLPCVVYSRISAERWRSTTGPSGMAQARIQVDVYDIGYAPAKALADNIRSALDGLRGEAGGVRIGGLSLISDRDFMESTPMPALYRVSMDFLMTYEE